MPFGINYINQSRLLRAFPCFDEPSFKSTFTVELVRPSEGGYIALSNMPVSSETRDDPAKGFTKVKVRVKVGETVERKYVRFFFLQFQKSVPMVTYLACFIVCDFAYHEKLTAVHKTK